MVEFVPKVTTPTNLALPFGSIVTPLPTLIPSRNVPTPTESTFFTSSYVNVPPIETLPEKSAFVAVISPTVILSEDVNATLPVLP